MKYVLLIYLQENSLSDTERAPCYEDSAQLARQLNSRGQHLATAPLHPVATATSVRVWEGTSLVTDEPFAETREQLGGFLLNEASDLDETIAITSQIPGAKVGTVQIRPAIEVAGLPAFSNG